MARRKKFTVTHPDGTVSTRSSESREYTHAVVCFDSAETRRRERADRLAHFDTLLAGTLDELLRARYVNLRAELAATEPTGRYYVVRWSSTRKAALTAAKSFAGKVVEVDAPLTVTVVEPVAITVCGPNLYAEACAKGTMHVHTAGCADVRNYGRGGRFGGEEPWTVELASVAELNDLLYSDFANDDGITVAEYVAAYGTDHWVAPCAAKVLT